MKNFSLFFSLLFVALSSIATIAQPWFLQNAPGLPNSADPQVAFYAVDDDVCWGKNNNNSQFLRTTDGGDNWTVSTVTGAVGLRCSGIAAIDDSTSWIAMNDPSNITSGGIFKTTDAGLSWDKQETAFPVPGGHPNVIHFFDADNGLCIGNPRGGYWEIYTTTNGGTNWIRVDSANIPPPLFGELGIEQRVINGAGNTFWFQTFSNSLYKTTNRGYTWSVAYNVCGSTGFGFAFKDTLNGLACDYFPENKISRTSDGGVTWTPLPLDPVLTNLSTFYISYAKGTDGSYIITSHSPGVPGTAYSNDDGANWSLVSNLPCGPAVFSSWNTGWCGSVNDSIYKWTSPLLPVELTSFTAQAQYQAVILDWVTATELNNLGFEVQRKVAEGDFATVGFVKGEGTTTNQNEYSYVDKNLVDGKYFYRLKQLDFNGEYDYSKTLEVDVKLLDNFVLEQNYPNPFNPTTTIGYVLQEKTNTKLSLINVIGEEVAILVNEEQDKGYHKVDLNASNLPSGVYLYKLQAGNFTETKKLMLLK
jgi:photosystem II stability/assembly factor-like uncharacterized protein